MAVMLVYLSILFTQVYLEGAARLHIHMANRSIYLINNIFLCMNLFVKSYNNLLGQWPPVFTRLSKRW